MRAREWARKNPHDAIVWMLNRAPPARDAIRWRRWPARRLLNPIPRERCRWRRLFWRMQQILENLVHQCARQNERAATAYATSKPPGEERRPLVRPRECASKANPVEAANLVAEWISPGEVQHEAAISVLQQGALRTQAERWVGRKSSPMIGLRARALAEVETHFQAAGVRRAQSGERSGRYSSSGTV